MGCIRTSTYVQDPAGSAASDPHDLLETNYFELLYAGVVEHDTLQSWLKGSSLLSTSLIHRLSIHIT